VPWRRIHEPQRIGNSIAVAGFAKVSREVVDHVKEVGGLHGPVLSEPLQLKETA
jgi:N-acyl-L-homoserine lactone synthetase